MEMERTLPALDRLIVVTLFVFVFFSMFSISIAQVACGLGGLAWLFRSYLVHPAEKQRWPLGIPFLIYALACFIAVGNAYNVSISFGPLKKLLEILIFFWTINCVRDDRLRDSLVLLLIIAALAAGLLGFYQAWENGITVLHRIEGTMSVYMTFAGLLMMVGIFASARALFKRPRELWLWTAVAVILACTFFTLTRQAWLGCLTGLLFLGFLWKRTLFFITFALIFFLFFVSSAQMKTRFTNFFQHKNETFIEQVKYRIHGMIVGNDYNFKVRLALWRGGWEIFKDHPLTGCGFHCVDLMFTDSHLNSQYPDPTGFVKRYRGMHNNFIQLAVDTGILGLTAWLGIWVCFFRLLHKRATALKGDPDSRWIVLGSAAAGIAFLSGGFFETNFYDSEVVMVLYFIMALPFAGSQSLSLKTKGNMQS